MESLEDKNYPGTDIKNLMMILRLGIIVYTHKKKFDAKPIVLLNLHGVDSLNKFRMNQQIRFNFLYSQQTKAALSTLGNLGINVINRHLP